MYIVNKVALNNFKCFTTSVGPNDVELRPLTLFYGYNNAGKSAFLCGICMILNSLADERTEPLAIAPPVFSPEMTLSDVITQDKGGRLEVRVGLHQDAPPSTVDLNWRIVALPDRGTHVVEHFDATDEHGTRMLDATWLAGEENDGTLSRSYEVTFGHSTPIAIAFQFHGLLPTTPAPAAPEELRRFLEGIRQVSPNTAFWLSSHRTHSRRSFPKQPSRLRMDADGNGFEAILFQSWRQPAKARLFESVSSWYERNLGQKLTIVEHAREFELAFVPQGSAYRVNICDVGQGLQETLPLLTAIHAFRGDEFSIAQVAVEEPESHLHPSLHGPLGREFCSLLGQSGTPRVLLETHSQNLLLSVQLEIARNSIAPEDVLLYWFRPLGDGSSRAERVEFDSLGQPTGSLPPGVFADDVRLARELILLQEAHLKP